MKPKIILILFMAMLFLPSAPYAHTVNYDVQQKGVAVRIFYAANDPASFSEYEIFAPGEDLPHQAGRTDKNGFVAFVPDRQGLWKVKVFGESSHGYHGVTMEVKIDKDLNLESFKKPLAATYTKLVAGVGLILGIFGLYVLITSWRRSRKRPRQRSLDKKD